MLHSKILEDKIRTFNGSELTTSKLNELGINQYYIKKLVNVGILEKVSYGHYKVKINSGKNIRLFNKYVLTNKFDKAYETLLAYFKENKIEDIDFKYISYMFILKKILGDKYDFSCFDALKYEIPQMPESNHSKFIESLFNNDLIGAYVYLRNHSFEEKDKNGKVSFQTTIYFYLMEKYVGIYLNGSRYVISFQAKELIDAFLKCLKNKEYEQALHIFKKYAILNKKITGKDGTNYPNTINLLLTILRCQKGYKLSSKNIDYSKFTRSIDILNYALDNKDYLVAYKHIGYCTYQNNSLFLNIYKTLLHDLIDIDKKNKKASNRTKNVIDSKSENKTLTIKQKIDTTQEKDETISYDKIYNLIYNRKYDEIKTLLENKELNRFESYCMKLIYSLENVKRKGYEPSNHLYESAPYDHLKRFYEALRVNDYPLAYEKVQIAINKVDDPKEFKVYSLILEDIIALINSFGYGAYKEIVNINKKIGGILREDSENKFDRLVDAIKEKYELLKEINDDTTKEEIMLNIVSTIEISRENNLSVDYFENLKDDNLSSLENLTICLKNGDYIRAIEIINTSDWNIFNQSFKILDLEIIRELIETLLNNLNPKKVVNKIDNELMEIELATNLREILRFIKNKRDYIAAYEYYLNNNLDGISDELNIELASYLALLSSIQKQESNSEQDLKNTTLSLKNN